MIQQAYIARNFFFQAPAVDVVGIGLQSGKLLLHNLKFDEIVMKFQQDWGPVTALTFRTGEFIDCGCNSMFLKF